MAPSPTKKKTIAKKGDKRLKMDNTKFRSLQHFERFYIKATIIQERFVGLVDLNDTFIPSCFQCRGWDKLLTDLPRVCEPLIKEFYADARLREHEINCWIRGHEFTIDVDDIDEVLGFEGLDDPDFTITRTGCYPLKLSNLILVELEEEDASTLLPSQLT